MQSCTIDNSSFVDTIRPRPMPSRVRKWGCRFGKHEPFLTQPSDSRRQFVAFVLSRSEVVMDGQKDDEMGDGMRAKWPIQK